MSQSKDIAYEYGEYSSERAGKGEKGHFVSVWKTNPAGEWKLALDLQKAAPKAN